MIFLQYASSGYSLNNSATENPCKDAPDQTENYAKFKMVAKCTLHNLHLAQFCTLHNFMCNITCNNLTPRIVLFVHWFVTFFTPSNAHTSILYASVLTSEEHLL